MDFEKFLLKCKTLVRDYTNKHLDVTDGIKIETYQVYIVWCCKTLQNSKALLSTTLPDGMYYEITYNGDKDEIYFDAYKKFDNIKIEMSKED